MIVKAIGFLAGQFGDVMMGMAAFKSFRTLYPDVHFTLGVGNRYGGIAPLFREQPGIDAVHIWDSYGTEWPNAKDKAYIKDEKFDIIFNGMAPHRDPNWFLRRHQTAEVCHMLGLPESPDRQITLQRWFNLIPAYKDCVAISGFTSFGRSKSISKEKLIRIVWRIRGLGFVPVQLAGPDDPSLDGVRVVREDYFEAVRIMLSCRLLVAADTGMNWVASAYNHPTVGLMSWGFYPMCSNSRNWQPENRNAVYLEAEHADNIPDEDIYRTLDERLK